jgi:hypothetical protein
MGMFGKKSAPKEAIPPQLDGEEEAKEEDKKENGE